MKEFMMIFRMAPMQNFQPTPEQMQQSIKQWQDWIGGIAAQGKFVSTNQLGFQGKTLKATGIVTDGPYAEVKEIVGGYIIVKANSLDEAMELAKGCPILSIGGHVEVRDIMVLTN
jgi:hypothetical protein